MRTAKPSPFAVTGALTLMMTALATATWAAEKPAPLVLEAAGPNVWRADARGTIIEFRLAGGPPPTLVIRFLGVSGLPTLAPPARDVILKQPLGALTRFATEGDSWVSKSPTPALRDGSILSIVEPDHRHDFLLNVHDAAAAAEPPKGAP